MSEPLSILSQLQADAFVTLDADLARTVGGIVKTASIDALHQRIDV